MRGFFRIPAAAERVPDWHVGPAVDLLAYHFSWLWMLAPLLLFGDGHPGDYMALFALLMIVNFVHRHFTLPYVYLDREVFSRHPLRFTLVPLALLAAFLVTPALERGALPAGALALGGERRWPPEDLPTGTLVVGVIFLAGLWNLWHSPMQKFGILRLYASKAREARGAWVPRWVDRLFVLGWIPLFVVFLGTRRRGEALEGFAEVAPALRAVLDAVARWEPILLPLAALLAAASAALFFAFEWREHRLGNRPRLSMGIGLLGVSVSFLIFNPIKVYMAYAFSHALEYMVFVWAFQRRRYAARGDPQPLLGRLLERPWIAYPGFGLGLAVAYALLQDWGRHNVSSVPDLEVAGAEIGVWVFFWSVHQSLIHFYYDGFLWRARRPDYRAAL